MQNNGAAPVLQLTGLHGDIIATAALSETETKLLSTTDASEYDVPTTSSPAKYSWLGGEQQPTEFPSGVIAMGVRSYVPQLGRYLQPDPVAGGSADAYAYVFGDPVNSSDPSGADGMPAWAVAYNNGVADQLAEAATAHRIEAEQRQAAEEAAARAAAAAAAQAAQAAAAAQFASTEAPWEQAYAMGGPSLSETIAATGITEGGGIEEEEYGSHGIYLAIDGCHSKKSCDPPPHEHCFFGEYEDNYGHCHRGKVKAPGNGNMCIFGLCAPAPPISADKPD